MSTTPIEAQEATITIEGYAYGQIAGIAHECPLREMPNGRYRVDGYVGLQISCPIWAVDAEDLFTPSSLSIKLNDSSRVASTILHIPPDTLGQYVADTLKLQILRQGNWSFALDANPLLNIFGYMFTRPGPDDPVRTNQDGSPSGIWPQIEDRFGNMKAVLGEQFVLCAYELGAWQDGEGYRPVAKSTDVLGQARPCPDPEGYGSLPEIVVAWVLPDILARVQDASPNQLQNFVSSGEIRPRWITNTRHAVFIISN